MAYKKEKDKTEVVKRRYKALSIVFLLVFDSRVVSRADGRIKLGFHSGHGSRLNCHPLAFVAECFRKLSDIVP